MKTTTIFAIETSCDETGVAVLQKEGDTITVLAEAVASQIDIHAANGGVVPEVAAREHVAVIGPLITKVLQEAKIKTPSDEIDAVAVTVGPGLIPALAVGVQAARTLAYAWQKPIIPVHHIEGHIYSALLSKAGMTNDQIPMTNELFPALALIVSGGHTMLIMIRDHLQYEVIGETRDDAAGEAFDKVARLLKLPYPGGPHLSKLAAMGDRAAFTFPRPMLNTPDFDFSFSGLKTAVLYTLRDQNPSSPPLVRGDQVTVPPDKGEVGGLKANIAASFEQAVVDVLVTKTKRAVQKNNPQVLLLAGGVAANRPLRQQLQAMADESGVELRIAPLNLCGDNAVMIGQVGCLAFEQGRVSSWYDIDAQARIPVESFST
jgi:N6-L-threonylcarbamoyladenine synthase